jgi:hypothetical protein
MKGDVYPESQPLNHILTSSVFTGDSCFVVKTCAASLLSMLVTPA